MQVGVTLTALEVLCSRTDSDISPLKRGPLSHAVSEFRIKLKKKVGHGQEEEIVLAVISPEAKRLSHGAKK